MTAPDTLEPRRKAGSRLWWGLATAALILGFADLARGGITFSAILLALAYCVFVPLAILK
jgi:hypothetical protein